MDHLLHLRSFDIELIEGCSLVLRTDVTLLAGYELRID